MLKLLNFICCIFATILIFIIKNRKNSNQKLFRFYNYQTKLIKNITMKNKIKTLGVALVGSMMATTAFTQMKVDGHQEWNLITGSSKGTGNILEKTVGKETRLRFTFDMGKLPNGMPLNTSFQIYGERGASGAATVEGASSSVNRGVLGDEYIINLGVTPALTVYAGGEVPKGIESVRTIQPNVTNRPADIIGNQAGAVDANDNTSGRNYIGFDYATAMKGVASFAFTPNARNALGQITDGAADSANKVGQTGSQYSFSYRLEPAAGLLIGAGILNSNQHGVVDEAKSRTAGIRYTIPGTALAVGYQYTNNTDATTATASIERKQNTLSAVFGVTKELNIGISRTETERVNEGVKQVDAKNTIVGAAYTLGGLQFLYTYLNSDNAANVAGREYQAHVFKTKVNF